MDRGSNTERLIRAKALLPEVWALIRQRTGILSLGLVLILVGRAASLVLPASTKYLIDDVIGQRNIGLLGVLVFAVLGATVVKGLTSVFLTQVVSKASHRLIADLRQKVYAHVMKLPVAYFDANKTGALVSRVMNDVESLGSFAGSGVIELTGALITAAIALIVLLSISPLLTVAALVPICVMIFLLYVAFRKLRPIFRERRMIHAEVSGRLTESIGGVRVVKGYNAEAREEAVFSAGMQRLLGNIWRTLTGISALGFAETLLLGITGALVMYIGARQVFAGILTLGDLVKFTAFLAVLMGPILQSVGIGTQFAEALAGLERTRGLLNERPESDSGSRRVALGRLDGEVQFENVSFAYGTGNWALQDICLSAQPGTVTALVGPSGSGKSTLVSLIAAFHSPGEGRILVDGVDLSTVQLSSYRTQLGIVLQQPFLFDGTIRGNVCFARPDATEEQILAACRIAHVDEFVAELEDKYETVVGERGVKLSGGQCQRVSIARAILAKPRILILDEATSSLDSDSESHIQDGLAYLMRHCTTFVIAHRLSTVRRADQILVMGGGRILERGSHESLCTLRGKYFQLYTRQLGLGSDPFRVLGHQDHPDTELLPIEK